METKIQDQFVRLADNLFAYLPNLIGGILLILLGWLAGWIIKEDTDSIFNDPACRPVFKTITF